MTDPSPRPTRVDEVADDLRSRILEGALGPGVALRETELEAHYAVSRHTVRRALALLVAERLATSRPYSGVTVAGVTVDGLIALQQLRCALESEAVRILRASHGDDWPAPVLDPVETAVEALATAGREPSDWRAVERAHALVHSTLVRAAGSPRITEAYDALDTELSVFLRHIRPDLDARRLAEDHRGFLAAARREGAAAVRDHLDASTALLVRRLADPDDAS